MSSQYGLWVHLLLALNVLLDTGTHSAGTKTALSSVVAEAPSCPSRKPPPPLKEQQVGHGTWPLLLLLQGLGKHSPTEAQGRFSLISKLPLAPQEEAAGGGEGRGSPTLCMYVSEEGMRASSLTFVR